MRRKKRSPIVHDVTGNEPVPFVYTVTSLSWWERRRLEKRLTKSINDYLKNGGRPEILDD